jgi:hypothetical protein
MFSNRAVKHTISHYRGWFRRKGQIFGGDYRLLWETKVHMSMCLNSDWLRRYNCLNLQLQEHCEWCVICLFVCFWRDSPQWTRTSSFTRFLDHTQRHTTVGRTLLDEWSAHRRDLYLTTHSSHNRQTYMLPVGFEPIVNGNQANKLFSVDLSLILE